MKRFVSSKIVTHQDYKLFEIVLVEKDGIQVLAGLDDGEVIADHVRLYDVYNQRELVYWSGNELQEDPLDPSSGICAMLSAIELVSSGEYRDEMTKES